MSLMILAGCDPTSPTSNYVERDSAGIRIVETAIDPNAVPPLAIEEEPLLRVGWNEEGVLFEDVVSGAILDDGRLLVADGGGKIVHILSPSGHPLTAFGGEGEGPGEFLQMNGAVRTQGDTILVADGGCGRLSLYSGTELVRSVHFVPWIDGAAYGLRGAMPGGYALALEAFYGHSAEPGWHSYPALRFDFASGVLDTLALVPMHFHRPPGNANPIRMSGSVVVAGGELVYGSADRPELKWLDGTGNVRQVARWSESESSAGDREWAAHEAAYRARMPESMAPEEVERRLQAQRKDFGGPVPHFSRMFGGSRRADLAHALPFFGSPGDRSASPSSDLGRSLLLSLRRAPTSIAPPTA